MRGVLYESALEVAEMMQAAGLKTFTIDDVKVLFNRLESVEDNPRLSLSNLTIADYDVVASELAALEQHYPDVFTKKRVLEEYTSMRYYTSIDQVTGTALEGTLHNSRVLNRGLVFSGRIGVEDITETERLILACAVRNLTGIGGKRNRGFGQVECIIDDTSFDLESLGGTLWNK